MGLFGSNKNQTKCDKCNMELSTPERLERHKQKAHGGVLSKSEIKRSHWGKTKSKKENN